MIIVSILVMTILLLVISVITNIQYFNKNKNLIKAHNKEKEKLINKQNKIDNYLKSLKERFEEEYKDIKRKNKRGYIKGYYTEGKSKRKIETYNHIIVEDEYENGDIKVSLDYVEYIKFPVDVDDFTDWIFATWLSLIESKNVHEINWLESKNRLNLSREEKIERLLNFIEKEEENNKKNKKNN